MENTDTAKMMHNLNEPGKEYSPVPLWFWNDRLDENEIISQISDFYEKGIRAFMIHPRMGIPDDIPYMSDIYLDHVETAVKYANKTGMMVCLYDEGMYPSGSAHGLVAAADPELAAGALVRIRDFGGPQTIKPWEKIIDIIPETDEKGRSGLTAYVYTRSDGKIRGIHFGEDGFEPGAPAAADIMNPKAVELFIKFTHDRYYERLSGFFGNTIFAIFTDEPSLMGRGDMTGKVPWTADMEKLCREKSISGDKLKYLFDGESEDAARIRSVFENICRERLEEVFYKRISEWCSEHGIALCGHPSQSDDIGLLRSFHIPGQDLVLRKVGPEDGKALYGRDSTLAKCSADSARQYGKSRNACECFGCCVRNGPSKGWEMPPEDIKWYIDWLSVRGVNMFMPHAFYYSLEGKRSQERPPDAGPAQTWWKYYRYWADYMARMSSLMTDARTAAPAAVLCTGGHLPYRIAACLFRNQIDFNYLEDRFLWSQHGYKMIFIEDPEIFEAGEYVSRETPDILKKNGITVHTGPEVNEKLINKLKRSMPVFTDRQYPGLRITCQKKSGLDFVLITNEGDDDLEFKLFGRFIKTSVIWDPWTGGFSTAAVGKSADESSFALIRIGYRRSLVLLNNDMNTFEVNTLKPYSEIMTVNGRRISLRINWDIEFPAEKVKFTSVPLECWSRLMPGSYFSGTGIYTGKFEISGSADQNGRYILDLGNVNDAVSVKLNGTDLGTVFWKPYRFDITDVLDDGTNELILEVMNSISCRMDKNDLPSGLLGPAEIIVLTEDDK